MGNEYKCVRNRCPESDNEKQNRGARRSYERWKLPVPSIIATRNFCFITSLVE